MNQGLAIRAHRWVAAQFGWAKHSSGSYDSFLAHATYGIGTDERRVDIGQVWRPDQLYVTAMYECAESCEHEHEFTHWYDGCEHRHVRVHLAMGKDGDGKPQVKWAVAFDVDTVVRSVPRSMWERQVARTDKDEGTMRGQSFMRLPLDILYDLRGPGGAILADYKINVEEPV